MYEFVKMIYMQWIDSQEGEDFCWGDEYEEALYRLYDILNEKVASEFEFSINKQVYDIQERSFIAGFSYACKCLSNGKIEIKK